jgi:hypothetical protein
MGCGLSVWPLNFEEVVAIIDKSGLYGMTVGPDYLETYFAGNPNDRAKIKAYREQVNRAIESVGAIGGRSEQKVERLWVYGVGTGAIPYRQAQVHFVANPKSISQEAKDLIELESPHSAARYRRQNKSSASRKILLSGSGIRDNNAIVLRYFPRSLQIIRESIRVAGAIVEHVVNHGRIRLADM